MKIKFSKKIRLGETLETLFAVVGLLFMTRGLGDLLPTFSLTLLRYSILIVSFVFIIQCLSRSLYLMQREWPIVALIALLCISFLWADFPETTLVGIRSEMLPMSIFGIYLATRFHLKRQLQLISYALTIAMLLSFSVAVISPSIGYSTVGVLSGIFTHKNTASSYGVLASLAFYSLGLEKGIRNLIPWLGWSLSIFFVFTTTSKTGLVAIFLIPFISYLYSRLYLRGKYYAAVAFWACLFVALVINIVISNWAELLNVVGGDPTLTGRTPQWRFMLGEFYERPWLGFGRSAYWAPETFNTTRAAQAVTPFGYTVYQAHNGFIELLLDVGWVGASIFILSFVRVFSQALKNAQLAVMSEQIWPIAFLQLLILNNSTESVLTWNLNLFWVLYVSLCLSLKSSTKSYA